MVLEGAQVQINFCSIGSNDPDSTSFAASLLAFSL